ncbi:MAG: hypothetical protein A3E01_15215 [Gammaproteobacteria bacterium RIFCSPHIGHO2_12_FULL_63_22]|nr:MAG: hypothetical protein A3E01_15215 [Gammaproteobacteria bacterium RIFCSPHIGHO2_12_FULL_63_22]
MTSWTPEAVAASEALAGALEQGRIRREGRTFYVPSRTRPGVGHRVDVAMDGRLYCNCEAGMNNVMCWAAKAVQKEIKMNATESKALVPVQVTPPQALVLSERDMSLIKQQAQIIFAGAVSLPQELDSPEKVAAVMMYGWELGLRPMTAIKHLYIVKGRVSPSAEVMAGLLMSRYPDARLKVEELDDAHCVMRLIWPMRHINEPYEVKWSDIVKAGLANSDMNKSYPHDRMIKHATKRLLRIYAPDVINGLDARAPVFDGGEPYGDDEGDFDERELYNAGDAPEQPYIDGQVVDTGTGEITDVAPEPADPPAETDGPATPEQVAEVTRLMRACKGDWSARDYGDLFRAVKDVYMPAGESFDLRTLTASAAAACIADLRTRRGEPVPGGVPVPA